MNNLLKIQDCQSGDIILCYCGRTINPVRLKIKRDTNSDYIHAAICMNNKIAAESSFCGVRKIKLHKLVRGYRHVAVFRQPDAWTENRIKRLHLFVNTIIKSKAKYNFTGLLSKGFNTFLKNKNKHVINIHEKLDKYFENKFKPDDFNKKSYFCSEFIVDCFIATDFIDRNASVLYKSDTFSPKDIGNDPVFGTFLSYISSRKNYIIPKDDEFYNIPTYKEIFENSNLKDSL